MFEIHKTLKGKPCITLDKYKFRESHTTKNGEIIWSCLGRTCRAKIKTDVSRLEVIEHINGHTGPHPVTMRSMSSPQSGQTTPQQHTTSTPLPGSSLATLCTGTPTISTPSHPTTSDTVTTPVTSAAVPNSSNPMAVILEENKIMKEKISELKQQLECVLDHSIENDMRLLQYTNQVFVANSNTTSANSQPSVMECGIQCDFPSACRDKRCAENLDLIQQLRTTIEVLQMELQCLRAEPEKCECGKSRENASTWTVVRSRLPPVATKNRFASLNGDGGYNQKENQKTYRNLKQPNKKSIQTKVRSMARKNNERTLEKPNTEQRPDRPLHHLSFNTISIESDSHGRYLAGLVRDLVGSATEVTGFCKPGAKLLDVASSASPPPHSCCVLLAGSNDVADGQQHTIYQHLERLVNTKLSTADSTVVVATLPLRHDLPYHHKINDQVVLVNRFISELCTRRGIVLLDTNKIGRRWFTRHGMHLRLGGKRLLARLLTECLVRSKRTTEAATTPSNPPATPTPGPSSAADTQMPPGTPSREPMVLPHDSFADAVKKVPPPEGC